MGRDRGRVEGAIDGKRSDRRPRRSDRRPRSAAEAVVYAEVSDARTVCAIPRYGRRVSRAMFPDQADEDAGHPPAAAAIIAALRRNAVQPEPLPEPGDPRWGISAILRPAPSSPAASCAVWLADRIAGVAGPHHVVYGLADLHVTVRSLEGFRVFERRDDVVRHYVRVLKREVRSLHPLPIRFDGVAPTLSGVIALSSAGSRRLRELRERLHRELAASAPVPGPEARRPRARAHMSMVLFTGPLADPTGLRPCLPTCAIWILASRVSTGSSSSVTSARSRTPGSFRFGRRRCAAEQNAPLPWLSLARAGC